MLTCVRHSQGRAGPYDRERIVVGFQDHLLGGVRDWNIKRWNIIMEHYTAPVGYFAVIASVDLLDGFYWRTLPNPVRFSNRTERDVDRFERIEPTKTKRVFNTVPDFQTRICFFGPGVGNAVYR